MELEEKNSTVPISLAQHQGPRKSLGLALGFGGSRWCISFLCPWAVVEILGSLGGWIGSRAELSACSRQFVALWQQIWSMKSIESEGCVLFVCMEVSALGCYRQVMGFTVSGWSVLLLGVVCVFWISAKGKQGFADRGVPQNQKELQQRVW
jgi:hypothetical protein